MANITINDLYTLDETIAKDIFDGVTYPWEVLPKIEEFILETIPTLGEDYEKYDENVYIHKTAKINKLATIMGPTIIGKDVEVRPGAFIRGKAIIGDGTVIGNSTEVKNAIIFNKCECPHYNYIGDAILGEHAHTGAGVILSNIKNDKKNITVLEDGKKLETNLRKLSGILGDNVQVGCNSVVCPGTIIGKNTHIYPLTRVRGTIDSNMIVKDTNTIVKKEER